MPDDPKPSPAILQVYGARFPQDAVEVFGTTPGLHRLINATIDAVNVGRGRSRFQGPDGHEAEVRVVCLDGRRRGEDWRRSGSPCLEVADPLAARIVELTEEVARLREAVRVLRGEPWPALRSERG